MFEQLLYNIQIALSQPLFFKEYFGNTLGAYLKFFLVLIAAGIIGKIVYWVAKKKARILTAKTKSDIDDILLDLAEEPLVFLIIIIGFRIALTFLILSDSIQNGAQALIRILFTLDGAWFLIRFIDSMLIHYIKPLTAKTKSDLDDQILPILRKLIKVVLVCMASVMIISDLGYNVSSIIAGLGIGGLAFALAAKDMLANMFGGLAIFTDKPFKMGDRIRFDSYDGTVQEIGLRTTRIKTLDGTELIIPNSTIVNSVLENVTKEKARKVKLNLGVEYGTTNKKMQKAKEIVQKILEKEQGVKDNFKVYFTAFNDFSLNLLVIYYIEDKDRIFEIQDDVNLKIKENFEKEKIEFAFPTQTLHIKK